MKITCCCFWFVFLTLLFTSSGCTLGMLDLLGVEEVVIEKSNPYKDLNILDDKIEDKNPEYDPSSRVQEEFSGCMVELNKSGTVTQLDIANFKTKNQMLKNALFKNRPEAMNTAKRLIENASLIPSMEVVNGALKPFNDGLYAAIELGMQNKLHQAPVSKEQFLYDLLTDCLAESAIAPPSQTNNWQQTLSFVAAALLVGNHTISSNDAWVTSAQNLADAFIKDPFRSRPIGFYTWNTELESIFMQDRFLQNLADNSGNSAAPFGVFAALAWILQQNTDLLSTYESILALYAGLTNPYASYTPLDLMPFIQDKSDLDDILFLEETFWSNHSSPFVCTQADFALIPSSRSKDTEFYNTNWCLGMPSDISFINEFIKAIRNNEVDLMPDQDSGWYDYQLYALETLLLPERAPENDHLLLTAAYKKKLIETFKSLITQHRETHVKQLQTGDTKSMAEPKEIKIYPQFVAEPFPTFYLRTARGYRFLQNYLSAVLGKEFMQQALRLHEDGQTSSQSLAKELSENIDLLYGLYFLTAQSVGLNPTIHILDEELSEFDSDIKIQYAQTWLKNWSQNKDIQKDPRVIVPVAYDAITNKIVYWATLGVKVLKAKAQFVENFEPEVINSYEILEDTAISDDQYHRWPCAVVGAEPHEYIIMIEQMEEIKISANTPPPTRDEFRSLCDKHASRLSIVKALENL